LAEFLYKEYKVKISRFAIGRAIKQQKWGKKVMTTVAKERDQDLRDDYIDRRAHFDPKQMIFVNESGDDRGIAIARLGYAPKGVTPKQTKRFHGGKRVSFCLHIPKMALSTLRCMRDIQMFMYPKLFFNGYYHTATDSLSRDQWSLWTMPLFTISPQG
jgi:hypothetical protein